MTLQPPSGIAAMLEDVLTLFGISNVNTCNMTPILQMELAGTQFVECSTPTINILTSCIATLASTPAIPHMEWTDGRCPPKKPQHLILTVTLLTDAHIGTGHTPPSTHHKDGAYSCLPDTGAQTCVRDMDILDILGISANHLIPTSHKLVSATKNQISVASTLCLSERAQLDLGIIPRSYSLPPSTMNDDPSVIHVSESTSLDHTAPCGCLLQLPPPNRPNMIPFAPTEDNVNYLEKWIISYYASSAFNIC